MTTSSDTQSITVLDHLHGHFYFADLHTPDLDASADFYSKLLGWTMQEVPGSPNGYRMASVEDRSKAALTGFSDEERSSGSPAYWFPYLQVQDADAIAAKVAELGGTVGMQPMDVFGVGRMATMQDPSGAHLGIWQDHLTRTTVKDEHGSLVWFEQHSSDVEASMAFYEALVGWKRVANPMGPDFTYYTMDASSAGDPNQQMAAGMMQQMEEDAAAGRNSQWGVYFNVDDVDATLELATQLGASVLMDAHDLPEVGRMAVLADPQGAVFSIMKPTPPQR